MLFRAFAFVTLLAVPAVKPEPAPAPVRPVDAHAECLKACAGAPKEASGKRLMACLAQCQPPDAGSGSALQ